MQSCRIACEFHVLLKDRKDAWETEVRFVSRDHRGPQAQRNKSRVSCRHVSEQALQAHVQFQKTPGQNRWPQVRVNFVQRCISLSLAVQCFAECLINLVVCRDANLSDACMWFGQLALQRRHVDMSHVMYAYASIWSQGHLLVDHISQCKYL